jgi:hypothetical protein
MRKKEIEEDENLDPAMECIVAIEEQRLGRHLNSRETDDLVRRFSRPNDNGEYPPINSQDSHQGTSKHNQ